jgi:two-component system sensor histidine kinase BaeS
VKFGIAPRLFVAVLLSFAALGLAGVVTIRWGLVGARSASSRANEPDSGHLIRALETAYDRHGSWAFLPTAAEDRSRWLRTLWLGTLAPDRRGATVATAGTYGDRIGLVDVDGQFLSGVIPGHLLRAIGSIDTRRLPLIVGNRTVGYLLVADAATPDDQLPVAFLLQERGPLGEIAAIGFLLAIALSLLLAEHFRRPIGKLVDGARNLEHGRFETRMDERRRDELGELARTFNHLAARLERTELDRRQWIADTSHELRTPLAVLRAQIESLQDGIRSPTPQSFGLILAHLETLTRRVDDLYELARADMAQLQFSMQEIDLWPVVQGAVDSFRDRAMAMGLAIESETGPSLSTIICDVDRMRQVLVNLMENAVRYTDAGGRILIRGQSARTSLLVTIDDTAPGVPAQALGRLGERFFRSDGARAGPHGGAGLGLALANKIVEGHGGRLEFLASSLGGLQARISLPLAPA